MTNLKLLLFDSNLLKSKIFYTVGRGGGGENQFPTFVPEFKFTKIQNSLYCGGRRCVGDNQFPTFVPEFKFTKIHNPPMQLEGGGW